MSSLCSVPVSLATLNTFQVESQSICLFEKNGATIMENSAEVPQEIRSGTV